MTLVSTAAQQKLPHSKQGSGNSGQQSRIVFVTEEELKRARQVSTLRQLRRIYCNRKNFGNMATAVRSPRATSLTSPRAAMTSPRRCNSLTPRFATSGDRINGGQDERRLVEYDNRLDEHQQTYVLSPDLMKALKRAMHLGKNQPFARPKEAIGFHGPRKPFLLSYPVKPRHIGRAVLVKKYHDHAAAQEAAEQIADGAVPTSKDAKAVINLAYNLRTSELKTEPPKQRKISLRPKTVQPSPSKAYKLAKEKMFVLDGIALSNIQDDYAKVQPKLGPAIPPYNSHHDGHVKNYFKFKGLKGTLNKTGQTKEKGESIQGVYVDRFHYVGDGHDYLSRRNRHGAGMSRELLDGHDQFLSEARPMSSYNGRFGFRRNTPTLRHCPSPFGLASRSSTY